MNKQLTWAIIFSTAGWLLAACGGDKANTQPAAPPPISVAVYTVTTEKASYFDQYPGTVTALNQVDIRPQATGYLTGIFFKEGGRVRKGQKLYEIDRQQYLANYQQAQAALQIQQTNLMKAQKDADRYHDLEKNDAIAKQTVDYADAALEAAKKQVDAARANVQSVQTGLKYTTIYAPFDGTIGISQAKLGTAVSAGQTLLNTISSDDPMAVDFSFDQKEFMRFVQLQQKGVTKDTAFKLVLPGEQPYSRPGRIVLIDRAVDPQTGTIKARLLFDNKDGFLKAGMSCNVRIQNNTNTEKMLIPQKAITEQMGEYFVFVVDSGVAHQKKLSIGARLGDKVIVNEGLNPGEQVVTDGVAKLKEGSAVVTGQPGAPAQPAAAASAK
jgi:membrane fusion protein (multidrug efflux system)